MLTHIWLFFSARVVRHIHDFLCAYFAFPETKGILRKCTCKSAVYESSRRITRRCSSSATAHGTLSIKPPQQLTTDFNMLPRQDMVPQGSKAHCSYCEEVYLQHRGLCGFALGWFHADELQHFLQILQLVLEQYQKLIELQLTRIICVILGKQLMQLLRSREGLPNPAGASFLSCCIFKNASGRQTVATQTYKNKRLHVKACAKGECKVFMPHVGCHMQYVCMRDHRAKLTFGRSAGLLLPPEYHCQTYPPRQTSACTWRVSQPAYFHHCTAADMQERGLQCAQTSTVSNLTNTDGAAHQKTTPD